MPISSLLRAHNAHVCFAAIVACALLSPLGAGAQGASDPIAQSVREPVEGIGDRIVALGFDAARTKFAGKTLIIPNYLAVSGLEAFGVTIGGKYSGGFLGKNSLTWRGSAKTLDDGINDRRRFGLDLKAAFPFRNKIGVALKGGWSKTTDVSTKVEGEAAVDFKFYDGAAHKLKFGFTGRYASTSPESGPKRSGSVLATGFGWSLGSETELSLGYEFEHDLLTEDNYSITFAQMLPQVLGNATLLVTAGKHRLIGVSALFAF
jgi:hypothetical protein